MQGAKLVAKLAEAWTHLRHNPGGFECWCAPDPEACDDRIACTKDPVQAKRHPTYAMHAAELAQVFDEGPERETGLGSADIVCPLPQPEVGTPRGFYDHRKCCTPKLRRSHLYTRLNGTQTETQRPCWQISKWVNHERSTTKEVEEWVC